MAKTEAAQGTTDSGTAPKPGEGDAAAAAAAAAATAAGDQGKGGDGKGDTAAAAAAEAGKAGATGEETKGSKAGDAEGTPKVPDKYSLVIPDDAKTFIDSDVIKQVETMARQSGWSNEDAQNALNEHVLMVQEADKNFLTQLKADPDYGGDKLPQTQQLAKSIIDLVRPEGHPRREAFMRAINRVAAGNHPEFVSFLADLGKRAAEDSTGHRQGATGVKPKSMEETFYGGTPTAKT